MYQRIHAVVALISLAAVVLVAAPAYAGVATGTLSLSIRIVDFCDVRTELPGQTDPTPTSTVHVPHSRSTCSAGVPAPRVTTTLVMPAARGKRVHGDKSRDLVKIVTIYF